MRLKKLEIYGFKSFAERTEIVFDQGITGIVGPNGSGKSNISDAVRWVLGEQNARSLRGAKMEDIIFNGSAKRKRLGYCEVTLVFENADSALDSEYLEVEVTRRVYRNGDSEYFLNKRTCRLKDIIETFRDTGIGKEGYSLIGQGRIDEILSVKSEDRRMIFEEAAGIVKFRARKEETERKLDNAVKNLDRLEDILEEIADQLEPLEGQAEDARQYLILRERQRGLELTGFIQKSDQMQQRIEEAAQTLAAMQESVTQAQDQIDRDAAQREADEEILVQRQEALNAAHVCVREAQRTIQEFAGQHNLRRADLRHLQQDIDRLDEEVAEAQSRHDALVRSKQDAGGMQEVLRRRLEVKQAAFEQQEAAFREAQEALEKMEEELEDKKSAIIDAMNQLSDVKSSQARLSAMRSEVEKRKGEVDDALEKLEAQRAPYQGAVDDAQRETQQVDGALAQLKADAASLDDQVRAESNRIEQINQQLAEMMGKQHSLDARLRILKDMQRDFEGYQHAVKHVLLHAQQDDRVRGVVADILRVPADYERAVEAVLGGALQNVVTTNEYAAKEMIEFLRQGKRGRATFLPMDAVRGRTLNPQERQILNLPGCLGVASELIGFDEPYRGIVESMLGRTLVAEDLQAGIKIMNQGRRYGLRLVTVAGDVMHSGGSMTGGSHQARTSSLLSRGREIEEHEEALNHTAGAIQHARQEFSAAEKNRAEKKAKRGEMYHQLHQEEIAVAREQERLQRALSEQAAHENAVQAQRETLEQLEDTLLDIDGKLGDIESQQGNVQQDTSSMQQAVLELTHSVQEARAQVDIQREAVTSERMQLAAEQRDLESQERDEARTDKEIAQLEGQIGRQHRQQDDCKQRLQAILDTLETDDGQQQALETAQKEAEAALEIAEQTLSTHQAGMRERNDQAEQHRRQHDTLKDRLHRAENQHQRLETDLRQLQDRIWEEYELTYDGAKEFVLEEFHLAEAEKELQQIRLRLREMGSVNVNAIEDYRTKKERYDEMSGQREDLLRAKDDLSGVIDNLTNQMDQQFREKFELLGEYFSETFTRLFGGGFAELKLADPNDALNCGIDIVAQPPGKKLTMLTLLSGGERALTAIAILFAMLRLKPTPFCILDEIEAALDDANISYFADYLAEFAENTQFVVVTHRKGTMERCDALYGVAMEEKGVSRMVSVQMKDYA